VYFTSDAGKPDRTPSVFVGFDGTGKERLTKGAGTHAISMSPNAACYARLQQPRHAAATHVYKSDGSEVRAFHTADLRRRKSSKFFHANVQVKATDGTTLRADDQARRFQPGKKYPLW